MRLFPKTFLFMLFLFGIIILITHLSAYLLLPRLYLRQVRSSLDGHLAYLTSVLEPLDWSDCQDILEAYSKHNGISITAEYQGEQVVFQATPLHIVLSEFVDMEFDLEEMENVETIVIRSGEVPCGLGTPVRLQLMASTRPGQRAIQAVLRLLPISALSAVLVSILFAYFYSRQITAPIRSMLAVTGAMKDLRQDAYFHMEGRDELAVLARHVDQVYARLWQTIHCLEQEKDRISMLERARVDFLRAASHELKTPLAGLRILLENIQLQAGSGQNPVQSLEAGIGAVDRLDRMLRDMLDASRIEGAAAEMEKAVLNIREEIELVLQELEILAKARQLQVTVDIADDLTLLMNPESFHRLWSNLIGNAVRYTPPGGQLVIRGSQAELSIWNSSPPLDEEQLRHIFDPFSRPGPGKAAYAGGNGLGLYIVQEILSANRLSFSFEPHDNGMRFVVYLKIPEH